MKLRLGRLELTVRKRRRPGERSHAHRPGYTRPTVPCAGCGKAIRKRTKTAIRNPTGYCATCVSRTDTGGRRLTDKELLDALRRAADELGRTPKSKEIANRATYVRHFGSFNKAVVAAGFEPRPRGNQRPKRVLTQEEQREKWKLKARKARARRREFHGGVQWTTGAGQGAPAAQDSTADGRRTTPDKTADARTLGAG